MDHAARHRRSAEAGFTLIELLVVMIIIAILMGVAAPTFLGQKNAAVKTQAIGNIDAVITAMTTCSSSLQTGGFSDGTVKCDDAETLQGYESQLTNLKIGPEPPAATVAGAKTTQVKVSDSGQGYIVQRVINDSGKWVYFWKSQNEEGAVVKGCQVGTPADLNTPQPDPASSAANPENQKTKTCKTGAW